MMSEYLKMHVEIEAANRSKYRAWRREEMGTRIAPAPWASYAGKEGTMKRIQFETTPDGNVLFSLDGTIRATVRVPEGASEDYGYLAMRQAILAAWNGTEELSFWYDGQEELLASDAGDGEPEIDIEAE